MPPSTVGPPFDPFLATADAVAQARPDVDLAMARAVFLEVATCSTTASCSTVWTNTMLKPWSPVCASIPLLQILAPRCAHVPEQRQELLETCTTRRAQPRPI